MKRGYKILLTVLIVILLILVIGPFLIPVRPLDGLQPPTVLARENSQFVTNPFPGTDGIDFHFRRGGTGEPVLVLLHGFASSLFVWDEVFDQFAERGVTFAYDRPAFGLSERLVPGDWTGMNPYSPDAAVDQLMGLLDAQSIDRAILVGNSAGGTLAMRAALTQPQRFDGLILISPAVYGGGGAPGFVRPLLQTPQLQRLGPLLARRIATWGNTLEEAAYHDLSTLTPEQRATARLGVQVQDWDRALWAFTSASQASDLPDRLAELSLPVLVITGDDDRVVPTEQSIRLAGELPNADLVVLPACGHVPQEECEDAFMAAVNAWLSVQGW